MTFWLALFVEGTRFTQEKLKAAQDYASIRSLPSPRNVLLPRTKVSFTNNLLFFSGYCERYFTSNHIDL